MSRRTIVKNGTNDIELSPTMADEPLVNRCMGKQSGKWCEKMLPKGQHFCTRHKPGSIGRSEIEVPAAGSRMDGRVVRIEIGNY